MLFKNDFEALKLRNVGSGRGERSCHKFNQGEHLEQDDEAPAHR